MGIITQPSIESLMQKLLTEGFSVASGFPKTYNVLFFVYDSETPVYYSENREAQGRGINFPIGMDKPPFDEIPIGYVTALKDKDGYRPDLTHYQYISYDQDPNIISRRKRLQKVQDYIELGYGRAKLKEAGECTERHIAETGCTLSETRRIRYGKVGVVFRLYRREDGSGLLTYGIPGFPELDFYSVAPGRNPFPRIRRRKDFALNFGNTVHNLGGDLGGDVTDQQRESIVAIQRATGMSKIIRRRFEQHLRDIGQHPDDIKELNRRVGRVLRRTQRRNYVTNEEINEKSTCVYSGEDGEKITPVLDFI